MFRQKFNLHLDYVLNPAMNYR